MMRPGYTNYRSGERRLIAFGGLQEIPRPATNPEKPVEPVAVPPDGAPVHARMQAAIRELAGMEHLVPKDSVENFRAKLEAIRAKLQALDASRTEAIVALEKEAYADCSPFLERSFKLRLSTCSQITNPILQKEKLDCEFAGEKMTLTLTPNQQVSAVRALGVIVPLRIPVDIERFDAVVGDNLLGSLRLIAKRFDIKTLSLMGNETRIEWAMEGKRFVASSVDVLEVVQPPKPELLQEYKMLTAEIKRLQERRSDLEKKIPAAVLTELKKAPKGGGDLDAKSLSADQKQAWEALKLLYAQLDAVSKKQNALQGEASVRILRAEDGTTVREEGSPESTSFVKWTYLDAEGGIRKDVEWWGGSISSQNEYEKGQPVTSRRFAAKKNGLLTRVIDRRGSTEDYFDEKGQKSYRQVLDPKKQTVVLSTLLFSQDGALLDEKALQTMTPEQIEAVFLGRLSQETGKTMKPIFDSCYSCAKYLAKCPRVKEIFRLALRNDPGKAFTMFETYQEIPGAIDLLEEAAYLLGDKAVVTKLIAETAAIAKLSQEQKKKIIDMSNRKAIYGTTFVPRYLRKDLNSPQSDKFLEDPALVNLAEVQRAARSKRYWVGEIPLSWLRHFKTEIDPNHMPWMSYGEGSDVEQQMMVMIARNLYFQNKTVTPETVMAETKRILDTRRQYAEVPLFAGRNVLHVSHIEKVRDTLDEKGQPLPDTFYDQTEKNVNDTHRFGNARIAAAIERQQNGKGSYSLLRPETVDEAGSIKSRVLKAIRTLPPPTTFLFDGHGGPDAFYLTDGQLKDLAVQTNAKTVNFSVLELADAFADRAKKFPQLKAENPAQKDICIFSSCYSSTFIRTFYERLEGVPKPITLAGAEYGQYGYSNPESPMYDSFLSDALQLKKTDGVSTFSDLFREELNNRSNPSLYIPDESGRTMQISRNDTLSEPSNG